MARPKHSREMGENPYMQDCGYKAKLEELAAKDEQRRISRAILKVLKETEIGPTEA